MKKSTKATILDAANEIERLATLETCSFRGKEQVLVKELKIWLTWFELEALKIRKAVEGEK